MRKAAADLRLNPCVQAGIQRTIPGNWVRLLCARTLMRRDSSSRRPVRTYLLLTMLSLPAVAQQGPSAPERPWVPPKRAVTAPVEPRLVLDAQHVYTLAELIDFAELHNPETRASWQAARERVDQLRIARSDWFPSITAIGLAATSREGVLFGDTFVRQTIGLFQPFLHVSYTLLDFGLRNERIATAREQMYAAGFAFNATHLRILFDTSRLYYQYLNAIGQQQAAEVNLKDAQTVQEAVEARLQNGLATLPDALEAKSAAAQADYELQAAIGQTEIARGALLGLLGVSPTVTIEVQPLSDIAMPGAFDEVANIAIERALKQRPDLAQRVAERQAAQAAIRQAQHAYLPTLSFTGDGGEVRAYGQQNLLPGTYAGPSEIWSTSLSLQWNVFDGGRREAELAQAHAEERRDQAEIDATRDQVEVEVWNAYINLRTAYRERDAAAALLTAAQSSYDAALESYKYGVRNIIDVLNAQRLLAQALSQDVSARTALLTQTAALAYRTGDLLQNQTGNRKP
jgi:outer membrane protein